MELGSVNNSMLEGRLATIEVTSCVPYGASQLLAEARYSLLQAHCGSFGTQGAQSTRALTGGSCLGQAREARLRGAQAKSKAREALARLSGGGETVAAPPRHVLLGEPPLV